MILLFDFLNISSNFLHGKYNKYAIKIPIKNGFIIEKKVLTTFNISPKLSHVLYTIIIANPNKNQ